MQYQYMTIPELAAELGRSAKEFRLRKRLEQAEVAELAGISRQTISSFEKGRGSSVETLLKVMKAVGALDGLNALFPSAPTIDPVALLRRASAPHRIYKKRGSHGKQNND